MVWASWMRKRSCNLSNVLGRSLMYGARSQGKGNPSGVSLFIARMQCK